MSERSVTHATFVIERSYEATPQRVFQAFADPAVKARWFAGPPAWETLESSMDFRIGGREVDRARIPDGPVTSFESRYLDIVPDERIIFAYDMHLDDVRISCSLTTVELRPEGAGTRLVFTEQDAFLDGVRRRGRTRAGDAGAAGPARGGARTPGGRGVRPREHVPSLPGTRAVIGLPPTELGCRGAKGAPGGGVRAHHL